MPGGNFVVQNGLTVGPLTIDAQTGDIQTSGNVTITGELGVSQISKNDSSVTIVDSGSDSDIEFSIDSTRRGLFTGNGLILSPDNSHATFKSSAGLTDEVLLGVKTVDSFIQAAIHNPSNGGSASTDFIAYADTGDNSMGFIDMGIASSLFSDPAYGITNAGDGYIFLSAPVFANSNPTGGNLVLATADGSYGDIVFAANGFVSGTEQGRFVTNDGLYVTGNVISSGGAIYQGPLAKNLITNDALFVGFTGITNPTAVFTGNVDAYVQVALHNNNTGGSASSDYIAYSDTGDDSQGFIDMGICSTLFNDPAYGITSNGDGYIFMSAPNYANTNPTGGNLVLATEGGSYGDIVFAAGGFTSGTEQGRFVAGSGFEAQANIVSLGGQIYQGAGSRELLNSSNVSTTLNGSINSSANIIVVTSTTGFLNHGYLQVDNEYVYYTGKSSTQFNGVTRGTNGTTAASHSSGATIFQAFSGLTDAQLVCQGSSNSFVQLALKNTNAGSSASTDMILYASNGDNNSGWIDMGVTSETYADATYGVTGKDDGYIFMSAPRGSTGGGNLFLSTDRTGVYNDIVFSTNGFGAGNVRMRIVGVDRAGTPAGVDVNIATTSTSTTTGALRVSGGVGIVGNLNVGGNFNLTGNISIGGSGTTTTTTSLVVDNPINFLANANNGDAQDIGLAGQYKPGAANVYTGFARDSTTKSWRLFDGLTTKPTTTVDWAGTQPGSFYAGSGTFANSTVASSTSTGALVVTGGMGIGGTIYSGGDIITTSNSQATSTVTGAFKVKGGAAIETGTLYVGGANGNSAVLTGNVWVTGNLMPGGANVTYNLGSTVNWWNTIYGVSTQARYADLAENYQADAQYEPGTVVEFGGEHEVTIATEGTRRVAGVVSTNPAHLMNGGLTGRNVVPLALQGRVPCKVIGPVKKGDLMVSAGFGYAKANNEPQIGQAIGKSLADFSGAKGIIEVVIGRI